MGRAMLIEVFSQRCERGSVLVTSNLLFDEWTEIFGSERLAGALLDRLTDRRPPKQSCQTLMGQPTLWMGYGRPINLIRTKTLT